MSDTLTSEILLRIESRNFCVGVVGLGYVGLPLSIAALEAGFRVLGFDIDDQRIAALKQGKTGIQHLDGGGLLAAQGAGQMDVTSDPQKLQRADAILIAVPTPLGQNREPDLKYVESSARAIAATLRRGQIVVLESTTWPGTTKEVVQPILDESGLEVGKDYFLGYSPEREDPGNKNFDTATIPKVVGADEPATLDMLKALYGTLTTQVVPVSSAACAEAAKLTENIFRSVNIALVNELKLIYQQMGIDVWEVIDAASTKPFGFMPFYPGPGLGGHCIPIDPFYLTWRAREFEVATRFIELAGEVNAMMPQHVINSLSRAIDDKTGKGLNGSRVLIIGMAYKRDVDDMRESPSLKLFSLASERGALVDYHDPYIPTVPPTRTYPALSGRESIELTEANLANYDAVLVATDHETIDWPLVERAASLVIDTRNVFAKAGILSEKVIKA